MEEAITELKQITGSISSNTLTGTRDVMYRVQLSSEVVKCIGTFDCLVFRIKNGFKITQEAFGVDASRRPSKITTTYTLNIPKRLVDCWYDLGKYEIEFDYENNCVELIKLC